MNNLLVDKTLRCMLAAWTLLATMIASSTYEHRHVDGDRPHQHDKFDCVHNKLSNSTQPEFGQTYKRGSCLSTTDFHQHECLLLLGAIDYLPMSSEPASQDGKSPCSWETIIAVSVARGIRADLNRVATDYLVLESFADISMGCICQPEQQELPSTCISSSSPLCDRARPERSGVHLA